MTLPGNQNNSNHVHHSTTPTSLDVKSSSPNVSPQSSPRPPSRSHHKRQFSGSSVKESVQPENNDLNLSLKPADQNSGELSRSNSSEPVREKKPDRVKKKQPWYSALYPTYKSRSEDFKRIFKDVPSDERLVVDYYCAIQKDILVHGRLYVSQNYLCFYANIFRWETRVVIRWKDVTALTKEKTALVIPNAILVHTNSEKYFLTSFASRDKAYLMLFRVWQNALMDQPMSMQEIWRWVHSCYGEELGLTSDDDDYISPYNPEDEKNSLASKSDRQSVESFPEELMDRSGSAAGADNSGNSTGFNNSPGPPSTVPRSSSEQLPTDLSDSSPSESESEKTGGLITCPVQHDGKLMLHIQVSIHVDQLFTLLFTNSKFFVDLHENRKSSDLKQSAWEVNPSTNQKGRTITMTVPVQNNLGPKQSQVTESQKMLPCSKSGEMYVIEVETSNAGIPYADSFYLTSHYCLTRGKDPNTSALAVYSQVIFRKSVWGIVKGIIEKNCWAGLEEHYAHLARSLEEECERTRRAMATGVPAKKFSTRPRRSQKRSQIPSTSPQILPEDKPLVHAIAVPKKPQSSDSLLWIAFIILLGLVLLNVVLYYKLWGLERFGRESQLPIKSIDLEVISREPPRSEDEWRNLLQKQEQLHSAEIERWLRILKAAEYLLKQVENSLSVLQNSIQTMIKERGGGGGGKGIPPTINKNQGPKVEDGGVDENSGKEL